MFDEKELERYLKQGGKRECWERTKKLHEEGHTEWRYPWRLKRFFTTTWKVTGITVEDGYLRLSNGRGKPPLKIKLPARLKGLKIKQASSSGAATAIGCI